MRYSGQGHKIDGKKQNTKNKSKSINRVTNKVINTIWTEFKILTFDLLFVLFVAVVVYVVADA